LTSTSTTIEEKGLDSAPDCRRTPLGVALPVLLLVAALAAAGCAGTPSAGNRSTTATPPAELPSTPEVADAGKRAQVRLELASAYFAQGQSDTALKEVQQVLALKPDFGDAYNLRALIYASQGENQLAEESFQRALQLNPRDAEAMHNYGWYLCQQRRFPDAQAQFAQALQVPTYRAAVRTVLAQGVCEARAGQWENAERTLLRAYEIDPASPTTAVNLSEVLLRRGEFERARFYIRRVNAQPGQVNAQTLWLAARIERKLGNQAGLQDLARELRSRFPQSPETLALEQGKFDE
jgi:type IV pilus assembly protein PilF